MDKKSIVLLIISSIILILAGVFAIWSFSIDLNDNKENDFINESVKVSQDKNIIDNKNNMNNSIENKNEISSAEETNQTKDFDAVYTDFTVEDENGNSVSLSDYKDKPVLIAFLNNENADSVEMQKRIEKEYENYKEYINFIIIELNEVKDEALQNTELPIYHDNQSNVINMYNITEFPTIIYINKNNEVFNAKVGLTSEDALIANLDILTENF